MNRRILAAVVLTVAVTLLAALTVMAQGPQPQAALGTAFTYQGRLLRAGQPISETCAVSFSIWDSLAGGSFLNSTTLPAVPIAGGLFNADLDYGAGVFNGQARYLEAAVKCAADSGYVTLSPRTALHGAPYALFATGNWGLGGNAGTGGTGFLGTTDNTAMSIGVNGSPVIRLYPMSQSPNIAGGYSGNTISPTIYGATIAGGGAFFYENRVLNTFGTVGGGRANHADGHGSAIAGGIDNQATNDYATVAGGLHNYATGSSSGIGGGFYNVASGYVAYVGGGDLNLAMTQNATIGGGYSNTVTGGQLIANNTIGGGVFNYSSGFASTIAGGHGNQATGEWSAMGGGGFNTGSGRSATVSGGEYNIAAGAGSTIGGGGWNGGGTSGNQAYGPASTIAGGFGNFTAADANYGVIGGGQQNQITATPGSNLNIATIGGGYNNKVTLGGGTVGGGNGNTASNFDATVGGGFGNTASGGAAVVPGGNSNLAQGSTSFAAGFRAKSFNNGCFTWADSNNFDFGCGINNAFAARSTGGFYLATAIDGIGNATAGVQVSAGGNAWGVLSDRDSKANFAPVDTRDVLAKVAAMPISTWNYKTQDEEIRHMGPVAQDFAAAFGVGEDARHISTIDADGVALAAIQGLYWATQDGGREAARQAAEIRGLQEQVVALRQQNSSLETRLTALESRSVAAAPWDALGGPAQGLELAGLVTIAGLVVARGARRKD